MSTSTPPSLTSPQNSPQNRSRKTKKKSGKGGAVLKPVFSRVTVRKMKYDKIMASETTESSKPEPKGCMSFFPKPAPTKAQCVQTSLTSRSERKLPADRTDTSSLLRRQARKTKSVNKKIGSHKYNLRPGSKKGSKSSKNKRSSKARRNYRVKAASSGSKRAERKPAKKKSQSKATKAKKPKAKTGAKAPEPKVISGAPHLRKSKTFPPPQSDKTSGATEDDRSPSSRRANKSSTPNSPSSDIDPAEEFMRLAHKDLDEDSSKTSDEPPVSSQVAKPAPADPSESGAATTQPKSDSVFRNAAKSEAPAAKSETVSIQSSKESIPKSAASKGAPNTPKQSAPKSATVSESNFETKNPPTTPADEKPGPSTDAKNASGGRVGYPQKDRQATTPNAVPIETGSVPPVVKSSGPDVREVKTDATPR